MKKIIAATAAIAAFIIPAAALGHAGDFTTSQNNATKACVQSYSGCQYSQWFYVDSTVAHPDRMFIFWRNHSDGVHKCYQGFRTNHYNVVVGTTVYRCQ